MSAERARVPQLDSKRHAALNPPLSRARVAAWVPLDADTLVQIGETTTSVDPSDEGSYTLPLPSSSTP